MTFFTVILWLLAAIGLVAVGAFIYVKHVLRIVRREHDLFRRKPRYEVISEETLSARDPKFFQRVFGDLVACGFRPLVSYENVTQREAGRVSLDSIWMNERDASLAEVSYLRVPRGILLPLPWTPITGKVVRAVIFVSPLSSGRRIVSTSSLAPRDTDGFPAQWSIQTLDPSMPLSEVFASHRVRLTSQLIERGVRVDLPRTAEEYFEYSWRTRRQLASRHAIDLQQMEDESGVGMFIGED